MKRNILTGAMVMLAGSLLAADASQEVKSAAGKLAEQANYSWKSTSESPGGGRFRAGPTEGKTEKGGFTYLAMTRGENTTEAVLKDGKGAIKTPDDGWQLLSEAAEADAGQPTRARFLARTLQNFKAPAAQAEELAANAKDLKKSGDVVTGELTEEGVKSLLAFGGRRGANAPEVRNAKGSVKFWITDGVLSKYEYRVQGSMTFNNNDVDIDRTTTTEIKDVGTTKVDVPADVKKKLS